MITWKELKEQIEKRIAELGLDDSVQVSYIDAGAYSNEVDVELNGDNSIAIYS